MEQSKECKEDEEQKTSIFSVVILSLVTCAIRCFANHARVAALYDPPLTDIFFGKPLCNAFSWKQRVSALTFTL